MAKGLAVHTFENGSQAVIEVAHDEFEGKDQISITDVTTEHQHVWITLWGREQAVALHRVLGAFIEDSEWSEDGHPHVIYG